MASREDPDALPVATFDWIEDIETGTLAPGRDESLFVNYVEWRYGYRYAAQPWPNATWNSKEATLHPWASGLHKSYLQEAVDRVGYRRKGDLDNYVVREAATARDVVDRLRSTGNGPPPTYQGYRTLGFTVPGWHGLHKDGVDIDLGSVVSVQAPQGYGTVNVRITAIEVDALAARVKFESHVLGALDLSVTSGSASASLSPSSSVSHSPSESVPPPLMQPIMRSLATIGPEIGGIDLSHNSVGTGGFAGFTRSPWPMSGTFRNLVVFLSDPPGTGATRTFALEVNGVASALTVTISGAASVGGRDVANDIAITAGDRVRLIYSSTGSPTTCQVAYTLEFEAATAYDSGYTCRIGTTTSGYVSPFTGQMESAIDDVNTYMPCAGVIAAAYGISTFASVGVGEHLKVYLYKNGVKQDGTGGTVDTLLDITNVAVNTAVSASFSLSVARGDRVAWGLEESGGYPSTWTGLGLRFTSTAEGYSVIAGIGPAGGASDGAPSYTRPTHRDSPGWALAELFGTQILAPVTACQVRDLYLVAENDPGLFGQVRTFTVRINGADTAVTGQIVHSGLTIDENDGVNVVDQDLLSLGHVPDATPDCDGRTWWALVVQGL